MKVYGVFQRFREDEESDNIGAYGNKIVAPLVEVFLKENMAREYLDSLYTDWLMDHSSENLDNPREVWESDFDTYVKELEVKE